MRADGVRDTGALLGRAASDVAELARGVHRGVAGRVFGLLGAPARPVQLLHDGICAIAYSATRIGTSIVPALVGTAAAAVHDRAATSAHDSAGRFTLAAVSGLIGDRLADDYPTLAPQLRLRTHEGPLRRSPGNVIDDLAPAATGRIVIFVHGLCGNDWYWQLGAERSFGTAWHDFRLAAARGAWLDAALRLIQHGAAYLGEWPGTGRAPRGAGRRRGRSASNNGSP